MCHINFVPKNEINKTDPKIKKHIFLWYVLKSKLKSYLLMPYTDFIHFFWDTLPSRG